MVNVNAQKAREMYRQGKKLVDIASSLGVPAGTVRRWKSEQKWEEEGGRSEKETSVRRANNRNEQKQQQEEFEQTVDNPKLSERQKLFCLYYAKYRNKVKAYQKAYQCSYESACGHASNLWKNVEIQKEVNRLLDEYREMVGVEIKDLFQWYLDIARADMNDFVEIREGSLATKPELDGTIISEISETVNGIKVKLNDRLAAMNWLSEHIDLASEEQKARIEALRAKAIPEKENKGETGLIVMPEIEEGEGDA